jgi:hypothetical protein
MVRSFAGRAVNWTSVHPGMERVTSCYIVSGRIAFGNVCIMQGSLRRKVGDRRGRRSRDNNTLDMSCCYVFGISESRFDIIVVKVTCMVSVVGVSSFRGTSSSRSVLCIVGDVV